MNYTANKVSLNFVIQKRNLEITLAVKVKKHNLKVLYIYSTRS
jgi:hypothetical protein